MLQKRTEILLSSIYFWLFIYLITVVIQFIYVNYMASVDESVFGVIGRGILEGKLPYGDFFDHKPPGIHLVAASVLWMSDSLLALRISVIITNLISSLLIILLVNEVFPDNRRMGMIAAILFLGSTVFYEGIWFLTEVFMVPFLLLFALFFLRGVRKGDNRFLFIAGISLGIASQFKQVGILYAIPVPFIFLYLYLGERSKDAFSKNLFSFVAFALGFLTVMILVMATFAGLGLFDEYYINVWSSNSNYVVGPSIGIFENIKGYYVNDLAYLAIWVPIIVGCGLLGRDILKRNISSKNRVLGFILLLALVGLSTLLIRQYKHYMIVALPFLAVFCAYYMDDWLDFKITWGNLKKAAVLILSFVIIFQFVFFVGKPFKTTAYRQEMIDYIKEHVDENRTIMMLKDPTYYFTCDLPPPDENIYYFSVNHNLTWNAQSLINTTQQGYVQYVIIGKGYADTIRETPDHPLNPVILYLDANYMTYEYYEGYNVYEV
ncbi:MAG: hypothetical protein AYK23_00285 [Candidatus Proteinoplasmatales archaeon SG8-5]|nr:MAG: hypothetical protein AYK23_00285 [Candidatus Proteinoplasmatales archaeon SG8-5]